jgi:hypothetical protein
VTIAGYGRAQNIGFISWSMILSQQGGLQILDFLLQYDAQRGCRPRSLCQGNGDGQSSEDEYVQAISLKVTEENIRNAPWLAFILNPNVDPSFLFVSPRPRVDQGLFCKASFCKLKAKIHLCVQMVFVIFGQKSIPPQFCESYERCLYDAGFGYDSRKVLSHLAALVAFGRLSTAIYGLTHLSCSPDDTAFSLGRILSLIYCQCDYALAIATIFILNLSVPLHQSVVHPQVCHLPRAFTFLRPSPSFRPPTQLASQPNMTF